MVEDKTVLIVGSGAREHAISLAYEKSSHVKRVIVTPGNDFISYKRNKEVIVDKDSSVVDPKSILETAKRHEVDLVDVANDNSTYYGTVDLLAQKNFVVFGQTRQASRIEWDKAYSKEFMKKYYIPTSDFKSFNSKYDALRFLKQIYLESKEKLIFIKASGLCGGKGALSSTTLDQAVANLSDLDRFKYAADTFLIEEGLTGEEFSYHIITDGNTHHSFKAAQDNKRLINFDKGEQTGGMGGNSPCMIAKQNKDSIEKNLVLKLTNALLLEKINYNGILYIGGIISKQQPFTIEYNARWGDPEAQIILPSLTIDYFELVSSCINKELDKFKITMDDKVRLCVVGVLKGYPGDYSKNMGKQIYGLENILDSPDIDVFGAGIKVEDNKFYACSGRLFSIVAKADNIVQARKKAYEAISEIRVQGNNLHYRTDIASRDVQRFHLSSKHF